MEPTELAELERKVEELHRTDVVSQYRTGRLPACGIESRLPLLTLNRRDFADFAEHDGLVLLGA